MRHLGSISRRHLLLGALVSCCPGACQRATPGATRRAPTSAAAPAPGSPAPAPKKTAPPGSELFADADQFTKKHPPRPGDWLDRFPERHQTLREYLESPTRKTPERSRMVLQPLGGFNEAESELLEKLREYTEIFFDTPTRLEAPLRLPQKGRRSRSEGGNRWTQHSTEVLLDQTLAPRLPADAVAYLGVTLGDLYPDDEWNYVFGQASLDQRVGVYSLVRFFPGFWGKPDTPAARRLGLRRSLHLLAHEAGHVFSLRHCVLYECVMNGSNSLDETDRQWGLLCPECLRKLHANLGFDIRARYRRSRDFYRREGLEDLASWIDRRLERIGETPG